jgi:hypothetical protein
VKPPLAGRHVKPEGKDFSEGFETIHKVYHQQKNVATHRGQPAASDGEPTHRAFLGGDTLSHIRRDPPHTTPDNNPLIRAIIDGLDALDPPTLTSTARLLSAWTGLPAETRALLLKLLLPNLIDEQVAALAGVHRSKLFKWPRYMRLKAIQARRRDLPRGAVNGDGFIIEAWYDEAG